MQDPVEDRACDHAIAEDVSFWIGTVKLAFLEQAGTRDRGLRSSQAAIVTAFQMRKERLRSSR